MKKLMVLALLVLLLSSCARVPEKNVSFTERIAREESFFAGSTMKMLAADAEVIAVAEICSISEMLTADAEKNDWSCEFQVFELEVLEYFKGEAAGRNLNLPVAARYRAADSDVETAYWKAFYEGQRYAPGDTLVLFVMASGLLFGESKEDHSDMIFIAGAGDGFYSSGLMRRIAEPEKEMDTLFPS